MSLLNSIRECGWSAYLSLLLAGFAFLCGLAALALLNTPQRRSAWLVGLVPVFLSLLNVGLGVVGKHRGEQAVEQALVGVSESLGAETASQLRIKGYEEAGQCIPVATRTSALSLLMGVMAVGMGLMARKRSEQS